MLTQNSKKGWDRRRLVLSEVEVVFFAVSHLEMRRVIEICKESFSLVVGRASEQKKKEKKVGTGGVKFGGVSKGRVESHALSNALAELVSEKASRMRSDLCARRSRLAQELSSKTVPILFPTNYRLPLHLRYIYWYSFEICVRRYALSPQGHSQTSFELSCWRFSFFLSL